MKYNFISLEFHMRFSFFMKASFTSLSHRFLCFLVLWASRRAGGQDYKTGITFAGVECCRNKLKHVDGTEQNFVASMVACEDSKFQ